MSRFFKNLNSRERLIVGGGLGAVFLLLGYLLVVEPFFSSLAEYRTEVAAKRAELSWMQQAAGKIKARQGERRLSAAAAAGSPLAAIDQAAKELGLSSSLGRVEPDGETGVRTWLSQARFDDLVRWLQALQQEWGLTVTELAIEETGLVGQVDARITLTTGQGRN